MRLAGIHQSGAEICEKAKGSIDTYHPGSSNGLS